jgi:hypothetical protein
MENEQHKSIGITTSGTSLSIRKFLFKIKRNLGNHNEELRNLKEGDAKSPFLFFK